MLFYFNLGVELVFLGQAKVYWTETRSEGNKRVRKKADSKEEVKQNNFGQYGLYSQLRQVPLQSLWNSEVIQKQVRSLKFVR